jgi:hypothetical protein
MTIGVGGSVASLVLVVLIAPAVVRSQAQPQAPAAANTVRANRVFISGENPGIRLLDKAGGVALTQATFCRVHWSPVAGSAAGNPSAFLAFGETWFK